MNLHRLLKERESLGTPLRVGLIGAGKFGSMYLSQVRHTPGMRVIAIADLDPTRARQSLRRVGWSDSAISSLSFFSDAIFAVLITVLVLDLRPPERSVFADANKL